jgi:hypothetical protein
MAAVPVAAVSKVVAAVPVAAAVSMAAADVGEPGVVVRIRVMGSFSPCPH